MFVRDADRATLPAIAWIHLVALGWITVTAFSILLHAIPAFLDVTSKQSFARVCLGGGAVAIAAFVVTLCVAVPALGFVATLVAIALFAVTLAMLALAMALGLMLAWALAGAALHRGSRGFLICGVSARTLRPLTGTRSRWPLMHVVTGTAALLGSLVLPAGIAVQSNACGRRTRIVRRRHSSRRR